MTEELQKEHGKALRSLRLSKGYTMNKLADACGISTQQVQKYETGKNRMSTTMLSTMCKEMNVSEAHLFSNAKKDISDQPSFEGFELLVLQWARKRDLLRPQNALKQFSKTLEEVSELMSALVKEDTDEVIDAIGDVMVTLIILSKILNLNLVDCLESAYNEIKDREGETVNGIFIKKEDK